MKRSSLFFLLLFVILFQNQTSAQAKHFKGNWTKLGTTYDFKFDLILNLKNDDQVTGVFHWQLVNYDENFSGSKDYYEEKIGAKAKEYVRGTYNPTTKQYILKGYKKDDPHLIIGLDVYRIKEADNGDIGGDTKSEGTWQGRINGRAIKLEEV